MGFLSSDLFANLISEGLGQRVERVARACGLDSGVKQNGHAGQLRQPEQASNIKRRLRQHARRQRSHADTRHHCGSDRRHPSADEDFVPRHIGRVQQLARQGANATGLGHGRNGEGLIVVRVPARRGKPRKVFFGQQFAVAPAGVQSNDHGIEFAPIETSKQVARRADANFDQQRGIVLVHPRDQDGQFRACDVVTDADGEALPRAGKTSDRTLMSGEQVARAVQEFGAFGSQVQMSGRARDQPASQTLFEPFQLQADRALGRVHRVSRAGKALELGDSDEGQDGVQVERAVNHLRAISLLSVATGCQPHCAKTKVAVQEHERTDVMPLLQISLRAGKPPAYRQAILDSLHQAMRETLNVAEGNQFMTITEHDPANFRTGNAFGVVRSDDVVYIRIAVFDTRTAENKKALYRRVADLLAESPGIRQEDIFILIADAAVENWSVGNGLAQFA